MTICLRSRISFLLFLCVLAPSVLAQEATFGGPQSLEGTLASGDSQQNGRYVDTYSATLYERGSLTVQLRTSAFMPVIELTSPSGETSSVDECPMSSSLACTLIRNAELGAWTIRATSADARGSGAYTLTATHPKASRLALERAPTPQASPQPAPQPPPASPPSTRTAESLLIPITANTTVNGRISSATPERPLLASGRARRAALHTVQLDRGDQLTLDMRSSDFDTYLRLERDGTRLASNDDAGSTSRSLIEHTASASGLYTVLAGTYSTSGTGSYTLDVQIVEASGETASRETPTRSAPSRPPPGRDPDGWPWTDPSSIVALVEAAPSFASVRGDVLERGSQGTIYQSNVVIPTSTNTTVVCNGDRCGIVATFSGNDEIGAITLFTDLTIKVMNALRRSHKLESGEAESIPPIMIERFTPRNGTGVTATVYLDRSDNDPVHGVRYYLLLENTP